MKTIHSRLREQREHLGLSMRDLASHVEVQWQSVQKWEKGISAPKRTRLKLVAQVLGVTPEWLLFGTTVGKA